MRQVSCFMVLIVSSDIRQRHKLSVATLVHRSSYQSTVIAVDTFNPLLHISLRNVNGDI